MGSVASREVQGSDDERGVGGAGREEEAAGGEHEGGEGEVWDRVDLAPVWRPKDSTSASPRRNEIPKQLPRPILISLKKPILPVKKVLFLVDDLSSVVLG